MLLSVAHRSSARALRHVRTYAAATHAVSSDGTHIAYTTTASGGTPTLLINGWAGCAADWGSLVDRLGGSGRPHCRLRPARLRRVGGRRRRQRANAQRGPVWKSKFYGAVVLNRRVDLHAIDATLARWRGHVGSSPLDRARTTRVHLENDVGGLLFELFEASTAPTASQRDVSTLSTRGRVDAIDAASRRRRRSDHLNLKFSVFRSSLFLASFRATV